MTEGGHVAEPFEPLDRSRPDPLIHGARVWLRPSERADIPTFVRWFNDVGTTRYLMARVPMSLAGEEKWYDRMLERQGKDAYHFVICMVEDDRPIGSIGFHDIDHVDGNAAVGVMIGQPELWGQGLGSDAMEAILGFGFGELRLERIWLEVYDFNTRARRSYEKCGFVLEGTLRRAIYRRAEFHDVHVMAILREEWAAMRQSPSSVGDS